MAMSEIIIAALYSGIIMGIATEVGHRAGVISANLIRIDGEFAISIIGIKPETGLIYLAGIAVHLVTSASFGAVLFVIAKTLNLDISSIMTIAPYVFTLWLSMLFIALPVAGQGVLGRRLGSSVWFEQLIFHIIFALGLWAMLNI